MLHYRYKSADTARASGVHAGTRMVGFTQGCATVIEVTYVGEEVVLARTLQDVNGPAPEAVWRLLPERGWSILA